MAEVKDYPPYLDYPKPHKAKTNADRIRSMTNQELAVFLSMDLKQPCDYCQLADFECACTETLCEDAMMKWLQQPAEKQKEDGNPVPTKLLEVAGHD